MTSFKILKNQKGSLVIDFIFAFMLVLSVSFVLLGLSFTLSVVESIQYLAFSTSRDYFAAHENLQKQEDLAKKKFETLKTAGSYKTLLRKDWFDVKYIGSGDFAQDYSSTHPNDIFKGTKLNVTIGFLNFNLPLFGSTEGDSPYKTNIASFLGREPSSSECMSLVRNRFQALLALDNYKMGSIVPESYIAFDDNGC